VPSTIILDKDMLTKLYVGEDISIMKIAKKLGYSATCIYNNLLRHNIPIMPNSRRYKGRPGRRHTEESRRKLSLSKIGDKNPAKRLDVRVKLSRAKTGKKMSIQARENMSRAQKGRVINWGNRISIAIKAWYSSKEGMDFIEKLRQRTGSRNPMFNKSEEIRTRHWTRVASEDKKKQIISQFRKLRMKQVFPSKFTKIEQMIQDELKRRKVSFTVNCPVLNICQPDIVIPNHKIAIQCDGDWWHANPLFYSSDSLSEIQRNNVKRDKFQDEILRKNGWHVIRFWESKIKENVSKCVDKVEEFISYGTVRKL